MELKRIKKEMHELEEIIDFKFNDINNLSEAMYARKLDIAGAGKNHEEWTNDALATVGDSILKAILADKLYTEGNRTKGSITILKSNLEKNSVLFNLVNNKGIINYAYNDIYFYKDNPPQDCRVSNSKHNQYMEAIIGAIYYDSGFEEVKEWVIKWLLPSIRK